MSQLLFGLMRRSSLVYFLDPRLELVKFQARSFIIEKIDSQSAYLELELLCLAQVERLESELVKA